MRNRILDAAEELFITKGFDHTSTNDIMQKAGIARGTLYNHFKSKEDVLDGVIGRMAEQMLEKAAEIAAKKEIPVLNRFTMTILALNARSELGRELGDEVLKQMHKPQNALMHQKSQEQLLEGVVPILKGLLDEGIRQGIFHTEYGREALEMILLYSGTRLNELEMQGTKGEEERIQGFIYHTEKLLGTEKGVLQQVILQIFRENNGK